MIEKMTKIIMKMRSVFLFVYLYLSYILERSNFKLNYFLYNFRFVFNNYLIKDYNYHFMNNLSQILSTIFYLSTLTLAQELINLGN